MPMVQIAVFGAPEVFNFFVMHLNVGSLRKNLDKFKALILGLSSPPSVLCLSETCYLKMMTQNVFYYTVTLSL